MSEQPLVLGDGRVVGIRPARQADLEHLLWGGQHLRASRQRLLDREARGEALILVPTLDEVPIGHLAVDLVRVRDEGGVYLFWFEVRDAFRGQGIGAAVVNRAEHLAAAAGRRFSEIKVFGCCDGPGPHTRTTSSGQGSSEPCPPGIARRTGV